MEIRAFTNTSSNSFNIIYTHTYKSHCQIPTMQIAALRNNKWRQFRKMNFLNYVYSTSLQYSSILPAFLIIPRGRGNNSWSFYLHFQTIELQSQYGFWQHHRHNEILSIIYVLLSCRVHGIASTLFWIMHSVMIWYRSWAWYYCRLHWSHPISEISQVVITIKCWHLKSKSQI